MQPAQLHRPRVQEPGILARSADINRRDLLRIELPSVNGIGHARAIAEAYGTFATGAQQLGVRPATLDELEPATPPVRSRRDRVLCVETAFRSGS